MTRIFSCCCEKTCCLVKCFSTRSSEKDVFRSKVEYNVPAENVQLIDMSNLQPAQSSNRPTLTPSAPNLSLDSNINTGGILLNQNGQSFVQPFLAAGPTYVQPLAQGPIATTSAAQTPAYSVNCKSGFPSCFCRKNNQQCKGAPQSPPF